MMKFTIIRWFRDGPSAEKEGRLYTTTEQCGPPALARRHFPALRNLVAIKGIAESGQPNDPADLWRPSPFMHRGARAWVFTKIASGRLVSPRDKRGSRAAQVAISLETLTVNKS
jgi:hypothetical protein